MRRSLDCFRHRVHLNSSHRHRLAPALPQDTPVPTSSRGAYLLVQYRSNGSVTKLSLWHKAVRFLAINIVYNLILSSYITISKFSI